MTLLDRHVRIEALAAASTEETVQLHIKHFQALIAKLEVQVWRVGTLEQIRDLVQTVMDLEDMSTLLKILGVYVGAAKGTFMEGL